MYVNGVDVTTQVGYGYSTQTGGTYVVGNLRASRAPLGIGGGFHRVSPSIILPVDSSWDSVRIYPRQLSITEVHNHLANGVGVNSTPMNEWCFLDPDNFGYDGGTQPNDFRVVGGMAVEGRSITCDGALPAAGYRLTGGNVSQSVSHANFVFPQVPFTVEGWAKIGNIGNVSQQFLLSYATRTSVDCLSVRANVGTYGVWVHWAVTVDSNYRVRHFINGTAASGGALVGSTTFCGQNGGSLVLGQRQGTVGGGFDPRHAPDVTLDSLRIHREVLSLDQLNRTVHGDVSSAPLWSAFCFTNVDDIGCDSSGQNQSLTTIGGHHASGLTAGCAGLNAWTSCLNVVFIEMARWIPIVSGVMSVPPLVHECTPYVYRAVPQNLRAAVTMHTLRFDGPGLADIAIVDQYADFVSPIAALSLDLSNNDITHLASRAFSRFGSRLVSLDLSDGALTFVDVAALHGLVSITNLNMARNSRLTALPDFWVVNLRSLALLQLQNCG